MSDFFDPSRFGPEDDQEGLEDLELHGDWFHGAVLWSTDWTTETILNQLRRGNIDLKPRYQRRSAWDDKRKSSFIESLILGLPIPQIILAEDKHRKSSFIVIDGKQRLLALSQFAARANDPFEQLSLSGLADRPDLIGKRYADLQSDEALAAELNTFENQTIRTIVIRNWKDERYLYSVFLRINTGSVKLSPQELRQAIAPGKFSDFVDEYSIDSKPIQDALGLTKPDFRMRDTELALRFFAYKNRLPEYTGNLKQFLDNFTLDSNKQWNAAEAIIRRQAGELDNAISFTKEIFGEDHYLRKWNGDRFERRINRAVFDIMTYYFSEPAIRQAAADHAADIVDMFKFVCNTDEDFRSAIEQTTKSLAANADRFGTWGRQLQRIIGIQFPVPTLEQNRLVLR